jgi:hypothetical protein
LQLSEWQFSTAPVGHTVWWLLVSWIEH